MLPRPDDGDDALAVGADAVHRPGRRRLAGRLRPGDGAGRRGRRPAPAAHRGDRLHGLRRARPGRGGPLPGHAGLGRARPPGCSSRSPSPSSLHRGRRVARRRRTPRRAGPWLTGTRAALVVLTRDDDGPRHREPGAGAPLRPRLRRRRAATGPDAAAAELAGSRPAGGGAARRAGRSRPRRAGGAARPAPRPSRGDGGRRGALGRLRDGAADLRGADAGPARPVALRAGGASATRSSTGRSPRSSRSGRPGRAAASRRCG